MRHFKGQGFQVLACSWNNVDNIKSLGENVEKNGLDGLLCTTWHSPFQNELLPIMMYGAQATWSTPPYGQVDRLMALRHLRQIGWDIPIKQYKNSGIHEWQVRPDIFPR
jgi:hypothetical protein